MSFNRSLRLAGARIHNFRYGTTCNRIQVVAALQPSTRTTLMKTEQCVLSPVPAASQRPLTTTSKKQALSDETEEEEPRSAIHAERCEYTRSGTDSSVASQQSSWDISYNTPESARQASDEESQRDGKGRWGPLEISPANQEVSRATDESGRGESVIHGPSKRISPMKGRKVTYGGQAIPPGSEDASLKG